MINIFPYLPDLSWADCLSVVVGGLATLTAGSGLGIFWPEHHWLAGTEHHSHQGFSFIKHRLPQGRYSEPLSSPDQPEFYLGTII